MEAKPSSFVSAAPYEESKEPSESLSSPEKPIQRVKAVKGDQVDQVFVKVLKETGFDAFRIDRIEANKYQFGTKKISCKFMNDKVYVRVGGGYMELREYIEKHSPEEIAKMQRREHLDLNAQFDITLYEYFKTMLKYKKDLTDQNLKIYNDEFKAKHAHDKGKKHREKADELGAEQLAYLLHAKASY